MHLEDDERYLELVEGDRAQPPRHDGEVRLAEVGQGRVPDQVVEDDHHPDNHHHARQRHDHHLQLKAANAKRTTTTTHRQMREQNNVMKRNETTCSQVGRKLSVFTAGVLMKQNILRKKKGPQKNVRFG